MFSRLFPGKTTTEALGSQLGEMVGMALTSVISDIVEETPGNYLLTDGYVQKLLWLGNKYDSDDYAYQHLQWFNVRAAQYDKTNP